MREWEMAVSERMIGLKLCAEARNDVVRELASHFEDIYDDARERGTGEQDARDEALGSVRDWRRFTRDVQHEKETFMTTTPFRRKVVYPGLIALVTACIPLWITSVMHHYGSQYIFHVVDARRYFVFNIPWLVSLLAAGAAGAWFSSRNGGSIAQRISAALFPAFLFLVSILSAMAFSFVVVTIARILHIGPRTGDFRGGTPLEWSLRIIMLLTPWVFANAISCLVGAAPFLWLKKHEGDVHPVNAAHA